MFRAATAFLFLALIGPACARAEVLTCATFKQRLTEALGAQPAGVALKPSFAAEGGSGRVKRYDWAGVPDLAGKLTCGADDAFADFFMAFEPRARLSPAVPADLTRFDALAAASVCALSDAAPDACRAMVATMTEDGTDGYTEDLASGKARPQNLQDYDFAPDLDAVFYVTPAALSWAVGPGIFTTLDAARPPFKPEDRDNDE